MHKIHKIDPPNIWIDSKLTLVILDKHPRNIFLIVIFLKFLVWIIIYFLNPCHLRYFYHTILDAIKYNRVLCLQAWFIYFLNQIFQCSQKFICYIFHVIVSRKVTI